MKIFDNKVSYCFGDLSTDKGCFYGIRLCVSSLKLYFDLPSLDEMRNLNTEYYLSVHDRKVKNGLKVRIKNDKIQMERDGKWRSSVFYWLAERELKRLFSYSNKRFLYVVIEEV